jgi:uncharacterized membrane protein YphA (DoxX/SURF4 family)
MAAWITLIVSALTSLLGLSQIDTWLQPFIAAHPNLFLILTGVSTILAVLLKNPIKK